MVSPTRQLSIFFLKCPLYSASRTNLLSYAARIFADRWSSMSKAQILSVFLFGSLLLSPEQILIYFLMPSLLYPNQQDFIKVPKIIPPVSIP